MILLPILKYSPCLRYSDTYGDFLNNYAYCQAGTSVHMTDAKALFDAGNVSCLFMFIIILSCGLYGWFRLL